MAAASTVRIANPDHCLGIDEIGVKMAKSRDPKELAASVDGLARGRASPCAAIMRGWPSLSNQGARELGFADTGALWRSQYDMTPEEFQAEIERLWKQVEPLYLELHTYVRRKLIEKYGDAARRPDGMIPGDLLGNMWAQEWGNIYDVVAPPSGPLPYDLGAILKARNTTPEQLVRYGEGFYKSIGFDPLPETFWKRSMLSHPRDRDVVCHASAWDVDNQLDVRIKACFQPTADDFVTVHHELGHNYYQMAYRNQPFFFQNGANDGFHEAIGDSIALNVTPDYLKKLGLIDQVPPRERRYSAAAAHGAGQDRLSALRSAHRQVALAGLLRPGHAGALQQRLVGTAREVSGHRPAGGAHRGRLRSRREISHPRQRALHALLPGPRLSVPVLSRHVPGRRLQGAAQSLLGLRIEGGRRAAERDAVDGLLEALARSAEGHDRHRQGRRLGHRRILPAADGLAQGAEQGREGRLDAAGRSAEVVHNSSFTVFIATDSASLEYVYDSRVHTYDVLSRKCNKSAFPSTTFYRQRTRYRIWERLLRGPLLQQRYGPVYVARSCRVVLG